MRQTRSPGQTVATETATVDLWGLVRTAADLASRWKPWLHSTLLNPSSLVSALLSKTHKKTTLVDGLQSYGLPLTGAFQSLGVRLQFQTTTKTLYFSV